MQMMEGRKKDRKKERKKEREKGRKQEVYVRFTVSAVRKTRHI